MTKREKELVALIRWMKDNYAVINSSFSDSKRMTLSDAGCGCCGGNINVPEEIQRTLESVFA